MAAEPEVAPLHLVNEATGEVIDQEELHRRVAAMQDQLDGAEKEIRAWRARYMELKRDREKAAKEAVLWPRGVELFRFWKQLTGRTRCEFTFDRFEQVEPFLKRHGDEMCRRAIVGHCFDPFTVKRKNGTTKVFNDWELLHRTADRWEEACNKAPADWEDRAARVLAELGEKSAPASED